MDHPGGDRGRDGAVPVARNEEGTGRTAGASPRSARRGPSASEKENEPNSEQRRRFSGLQIPLEGRVISPKASSLAAG